MKTLDVFTFSVYISQGLLNFLSLNSTEAG
jgi:hypothetical protein